MSLELILIFKILKTSSITKICVYFSEINASFFLLKKTNNIDLIFHYNFFSFT